MDWGIGSICNNPEIRYGILDIFRVFSTSLKNLWKVSTTFLASEIILSFQ